MEDTLTSPCGICHKDVRWTRNECFVIDHIIPNKSLHPSRAIFFCTDCFYDLAGKEWTDKLEYTKKELKKNHDR